METLKERVLDILTEKGPISISQISKTLEKNKEYVSGYLQGLADSGLLKAKKVGRAKIFLVEDGNRTTFQRFSVNTGQKQAEM